MFQVFFFLSSLESMHLVVYDASLVYTNLQVYGTSIQAYHLWIISGLETDFPQS